MPIFVKNHRSPADDGIVREIDKWRLVSPREYEEVLKDALVVISFNLVHYDIGGEDVWSAYITHVRKLRPTGNRAGPGSAPSSPDKRSALDALMGLTPKRKRTHH